MFQVEKQYIRTLFELGHFYNPATPNGHNVLVKDLDTLTLNHQLVKDAVRSFQDMGGEVFNQICLKHHGRNASFDGEFGPATNQLFNTPRCGEPDYYKPEVLGQRAAIGVGSWPEPCQKAGIKIHINKSKMPSVLVSRWTDIQKKVFAAYHKIGANVVEVANANEAHITVWWEPLFGSTIGIAQFNSQSCSGKVWCKLDTGYTDMVDTLWCHELGHNMNLNHTSGGVMNSFIMRVDELWATTDPSYKTLVKYFGGQPVGPVEPTLELKVVGQQQGTTKVVVDFAQREVQATINNMIKKYVLLSNDII
jgi:hypothetical protein